MRNVRRLATMIDAERAREAGTFSRLANNLSALSFLIDMLNYQPTLAKKLFVFDAEQGELRPVMGREAARASVTSTSMPQPSLGAQAEQALQSVTAAAQGLPSATELVDLTERLDGLAEQAALADNAPLAQAARDAATAVAAMETPSAPPMDAAALSGLTAMVPPAVDPEPCVQEDDIVEDDLLDIFLEEARDVIQAGLAAAKALYRQPDSLGDKTTLRRAFHMLKGSSRMVGLGEFGEAAWAMEQVLNSVLAEQRPVEPALLSLAQEAMTELARWVEDIDQNQDGHWKAQPFRNSAQAWRDRREHLPLAAAEPESPGEVVEVVELVFKGQIKPANGIKTRTRHARD